MTFTAEANDMVSNLINQATYTTLTFKHNIFGSHFQRKIFQISDASCSLHVTKVYRTLFDGNGESHESYDSSDADQKNLQSKLLFYEVWANRGTNNEILEEKRVIAKTEQDYQSLDENYLNQDQIISHFQSKGICKNFGVNIFQSATQSCRHESFLGMLECEKLDITQSD